MKTEKSLYDEIFKYAKSEKIVSVPILQKRFALGYIPARRAIDDLLEDRCIATLGGVEYRYLDPAEDKLTQDIKKKITENKGNFHIIFEPAVKLGAKQGYITISDVQSLDSHILFVQASKLLDLMQQIGICSEKLGDNRRAMKINADQAEYIFAPEEPVPPSPRPTFEEAIKEIKQTIFDITVEKFKKEVNVAGEQIDPPRTVEELRAKLEEAKRAAENNDADDDDDDDDDDYENYTEYDADDDDGISEEEIRRIIDEAKKREIENEKLKELLEPPLWNNENKSEALNAQIDRIVKRDRTIGLCDAIDVACELMRLADYKGDDAQLQFLRAVTFALKTMTFEEFYAVKSRLHGLDTAGGHRIDVVFVVDGTDKLALPKKFSESIGEFDRKLDKAIEESGGHCSDVRLRVVHFGDYAEDEEAVVCSEFYSVPEERDRFKRAFYVAPYKARKGSGKALNALEALYCAIKSDFAPVVYNEKGKQVIVMLTNKYPLTLGERKGFKGYTRDAYPVDLRGLQTDWETPRSVGAGGLSAKNSRLILFVPDGDDGNGHSWKGIAGFERTTVTYASAEQFGKDIDIDTIIAEILRS